MGYCLPQLDLIPSNGDNTVTDVKIPVTKLSTLDPSADSIWEYNRAAVLAQQIKEAAASAQVQPCSWLCSEGDRAQSVCDDQHRSIEVLNGLYPLEVVQEGDTGISLGVLGDALDCDPMPTRLTRRDGMCMSVPIASHTEADLALPQCVPAGQESDYRSLHTSEPIIHTHMSILEDFPSNSGARCLHTRTNTRPQAVEETRILGSSLYTSSIANLEGVPPLQSLRIDNAGVDSGVCATLGVFMHQGNEDVGIVNRLFAEGVELSSAIRWRETSRLRSARSRKRKSRRQGTLRSMPLFRLEAASFGCDTRSMARRRLFTELSFISNHNHAEWKRLLQSSQPSSSPILLLLGQLSRTSALPLLSAISAHFDTHSAETLLSAYLQVSFVLSLLLSIQVHVSNGSSSTVAKWFAPVALLCLGQTDTNLCSSHQRCGLGHSSVWVCVLLAILG